MKINHVELFVNVLTILTKFFASTITKQHPSVKLFNNKQQTGNDALPSALLISERMMNHIVPSSPFS